jgi:hypothetical protein
VSTKRHSAQEMKGFRFGTVLAMNGSEMKTTRQIRDLGKSLSRFCGRSFGQEEA